MMIKLTGLNDNIFEINSNMIVYYTPNNIRQIREGEDDVIQEATQITVVGNEKIYVKETPEYIRMLLNLTDINKQNNHQELKTYQVTYVEDFVHLSGIDDIEAYSADHAFEILKKQLSYNSCLFNEIFKDSDNVSFYISDNHKIQHKYMMNKNMLLNNSDKKLFNVLFTTSNNSSSFMYFYDFIPDVYAYDRNDAFKEVKKSLILDNDLRDRVFKATDKEYIILRNETDRFNYSLRKNELEDQLYDKKQINTIH